MLAAVRIKHLARHRPPKLSPHADAAPQRGVGLMSGFEAVAADFGGCLTAPHAHVDPRFGCRPVAARAADALRLLHARGVRLVLSSNDLPHQDRRLALRSADVEHLFTAVVTSTSLGYAKPDPRFYEAVIKAAGCGPEKILHVGNRLDYDVLIPIAMGIGGGVHIKPGRPNPADLLDDVVRISCFAELPALLPTLTPRRTR